MLCAACELEALYIKSLCKDWLKLPVCEFWTGNIQLFCADVMLTVPNDYAWELTAEIEPLKEDLSFWTLIFGFKPEILTFCTLND